MDIKTTIRSGSLSLLVADQMRNDDLFGGISDLIAFTPLKYEERKQLVSAIELLNKGWPTLGTYELSVLVEGEIIKAVLPSVIPVEELVAEQETSDDLPY